MIPGIKRRWADIIRDWMANSVAASPLVPSRLRFSIYQACGVRLDLEADPIFILPHCHFNGFQVKIGRGSFINTGCFFQSQALIEIGERCNIGMQVMFCTVTHKSGDSNRRAGEFRALPIRVGNGCWIGTRALILPGVRIGDGCVIGAGALVSKDCQPNGLYVGLPAKRVRELS